jgi:hypothetical protein
VVPVHADGKIAATLGEADLQLGSWGRGRRPGEKHAREIPDLNRRPEQPVRRSVDAREGRIRSGYDNLVTLAVQSRVIAVGERRIGTHRIVGAELRCDVFPGRVLADWIDRGARPLGGRELAATRPQRGNRVVQQSRP